MDPVTPTTKRSSVAKLVRGACAFAVCGLLVAGGVWGVPRLLSRGSPAGKVLTPYADAWKSFQGKVESIQRLEEENHKLHLENRALRQWAEAGRYNCKLEAARVQAESAQRRLASEAGAATARLRETISYRVPEQLLPDQLFTLGHTYLKARENEKAAILLSYLTELPNDRTYRTPQAYLLTGVAWYRLHHYREADRYFDLVLGSDPKAPNLRYHAQARLWRALSAERRGDATGAQKWLGDLLDHHPRAVETAWVNRAEKEIRKPAKEGATDAHHPEPSSH